MKLDISNGRITVDASELAPLLDLEPKEFRRRMQACEIAVLSETGQGDDAGTFRVTFQANRWKVRLTYGADGEVLKRSRASVGA